MKFDSHGNFWRPLVVLLCVLSGGLEAKPIRLRNELIDPGVPAGRTVAAAAAPPAEMPARGLYLVQFIRPPRPEWRTQLLTLGVELLQYVPEDTFVTKFDHVTPGRVRQLSFVRWVGPYRPAHKVHGHLQTARTNVAPLGLAVLLSPRASEAEIQQTKAHFLRAGQEARLRSGRIIRGEIQPSQLDALALSDVVLWIEPAPRMKLYDEVSSKIVAGDGGANTLLTESLGYDGAGVTVAVADSGLDSGDTNSLHPDIQGRVRALLYYGSLTDASDGHSHGTHCAGIIAGNGAVGETDENGCLYGLGVAPGARIVVQRIFDDNGGYVLSPTFDFETLTRDARNAGAEIGSNSWGDDTQGRYDLSARAFDELVRDADSVTPGDQPYILEFSAGNAGPGEQSIGSPAVAKNVLATGASVNNRFNLPLPEFSIYDTGQETMADFSSRGPCEDGRIKPDLVAPGTWIASLRSVYANDDYAWWPISDDYMYQGGTSQAGPHASGAAAVFVQYYRAAHGGATPSPALVKAALINSAADMDNGFDTAPVPNPDEGWGRIDLTGLIGAEQAYTFLDQSILLTNAQVYETNVVVASSGTPLKITLTYTDVPGFPGAARALVNDLDLEVLGPDGRVYRDNQFLEGESVPDASTPDHLNNVEGVHFAAPLPGQYTVRVRARSVPEDACADTAAVDQDFALVISSDLLEAGASLMFLDATAYTVPAQIRLNVIDPDQAGAPSVSVNLRSTTEPAGEDLVLLSANASGLFTGAVATATGPAARDGRLQVHHNDLIAATYFDESAGAGRAASARADLVAPVLSGVSSSNQVSRVIVTWSSDEPSTSMVRYFTNANWTLAETNVARVTEHSMVLTELTANATYFYVVISTDAAGNVRTNDNGGSLFTFVAPQISTILLVDDYFDELFGQPPLTEYTGALDAVGFAYDVWVVADNGAPTTGDLLRYAAVIWRIDGFFNTWSASQRQAISNYLNAGGAMMVASMELLSRLQAENATNFIQTVLHVQSWVDDESGSTGAAEIIGAPAEPIGNGIDLVLDYETYNGLWFGAIGPDLSDTLLPTADAMPVFHNDADDIVGLRWPRVGEEAPGRLVFFSFPFDAVPMTGAGNDRIQLLSNVLSFLIPGAQGIGNVALSATAFPVPGNVVIEVADSDLSGAGTLSVTAATATDAAGVSVLLGETARAGVFRGSCQLVPAGQTPAAGQLRAAHGDDLWVDYFDASRGSNVRAIATVDTIAPSISAVEARPGYQDAYVTWETSELTDALVQFGESPLLGRTAYSSSFSTSHEVRLPGLLPSRTYYFRVVSRDAAGNAATDDNSGLLHRFVTLTPIPPPWSDSLDSGAGAWTLFTSDDSQSEWTLGVPNNGWETSAHSPPAAWGCNLNGWPIDYTETFLISPAIDLTGASSASLEFWHSCDFTGRSEFDILETAQVYALNESEGTLTSLGFYDGFASGGWENEVLNLTPFAGKVIYLVWGYQLLSFESVSRPGWLVDDVSVTAVLLPSGIITVTNTLSQATFTLNGPTTRMGAGLWTVFTNAPVGEYVAAFGPVPYYTAPSSQTNILAPGGTITFVGNYAFADVNTNGIADGWEQVYFGSVPPNHLPQTDTDGDGLSDYAEFVAGTNPTNSNSALQVASAFQAVSGFNLQWPAAPGRAYRVLGSGDLTSWAAATDWMRATGNSAGTNLPVAGNAPRFYRVEVQP